MVPPAGFEPARPKAVDFESTVSTVSPRGLFWKNQFLAVILASQEPKKCSLKIN